MKVLLVLAVVVACAVAKDDCFDTKANYNGKNFGEVMKTCFGTKTQADAEIYECMLGPNQFNVAAEKLHAFLKAVGISTRVEDLCMLANDCIKDKVIDFACLHGKYNPICGDDEHK